MITAEELEKLRPSDPEKIDALVAQMDAEERAYKLREMRNQYALTQAQLAENIGVGQAQVSNIEKGDTSKARVETLRKYIEGLGGTLTVQATFGETSYTIA